jgi:ribosome biogenesis GTPase / thiamine phosphate phosphatase
MGSRHSELKVLGWGDWFEERVECNPSDTVARVTAVDRDLMLLLDQAGPFRAKLAGAYRYRHQLTHESPCVGDWVCVEKPPGDGAALIHAILERRTSLRRKAAGNAATAQMIAANVDCVIIVQSCHVDFNLKRLERYLVTVWEGGAEPCILLTKTDLVEPGELESQMAAIRSAGIVAPVMTLSNVTHAGLEDFRKSLLPGKTYCFVGSSGVGKSTLINHLVGREVLETKAVSGTGEGRHTTVRRELIRLEGGALVIDNPGMRELGVLDADSGIESGFSDITALASSCRFRDCGHTNEPGCAVLQAVNSGVVSQEHFRNYLKLRDESRFHQMSHAEKRKKDRDFGKFIKSVKKNLEND